MCKWNVRLLVNDIVLALVINTSATLLAGAPLEWGSWYPYTCVAFTTNVIAQLLIPTVSIANSLTRRLDHSALRPYVGVFVENLIFVTIISLTEAATQVGMADMIPTWWSTYLWLVLIGYVTSVVLSKIPSKSQG
ncbi:ABC transporter ATPase [Olsenella sp. AM30-3LB]|uniref:ABC transporter ATPase n=1 Tax=Olsenella sp. AM30-3LB TaxID=2292359 RepID=UPI000E532BBC|nr:ABC transporter ATPase [Olsenella sp. AM30-3LB]RHD73332.1 ABC transporter ATPase [Olsenella sp. AM30-3LB]